MYTFRVYTECPEAIRFQVKLEHCGEQGHSGPDHSETGLWHVDLEQNNTQCDGIHSVQIVATKEARYFYISEIVYRKALSCCQ
jgi:hypothetical protein